ncbi:hypothetical protein [Actinomadura sp. 9N407]|uniref:hypothetical protein n=1 Tax=Actinomadura sp. 9N407 TaxID=3375154 RepID=UPI00378FDC0C
MQQVAIRAGAREALDRTTRARVPGVLRMAVVAGLAFAGWFALAALAGSASADSGDGRPVAGRDGGEAIGLAGDLAGDLATGLTTSATGTGSPQRETVRKAGDRLLRAPSSTLTGLVSGAPGLRELRPAASGLAERAGLPDRHAVHGLLSPLTGRAVPDALFGSEGGRPHGGDRDSGTARGADGPGGDTDPRPAATPRTAGEPGGTCRGCDRADGVPTAPRPFHETGQDDAKAALTQPGQGHGPIAGTLPASLPDVPDAMAARALPASAPKEEAAPADPVTAPD